MDSINPARIRKALLAARETVRELEAALNEAERPRPDPYPGPVKVKVSKTTRRISE
jgi:hypothetical protein